MNTSNKLRLGNFTFNFAGHGHYKVTFQSSVTKKTWTITTNNMPLIDATRNNPFDYKMKDLVELKKLCKNG